MYFTFKTDFLDIHTESLYIYLYILSSVMKNA